MRIMPRMLPQTTDMDEPGETGTSDTDIVAAWPTPASASPLETVETRLLEREMKFAVARLEPIEERLSALDGTRAQFIGVTHERNCVLDTEHDVLKSRAERLRVREVEGQPGVKVTWKGPATIANGVRRREEREFHADDRAACLAVLSNLGLRPVQPYEKVRSTWRVDGVLVCLDSLPFGCFVELELTSEIGESEEAGVVERLVTLLGLDQARRIQASYARLQQEWQDILNKYERKAEKAPR